MSTDPREFEHPIDGTGGTVPPLVDVIAEVLAYEHCKRVNPKADHPIMGYRTFHPDQREHLRGVQMDVARAVLAAISETGAVEWGIEIETPVGTARAKYGTKAEADSHCHGAVMPTKTVSRITGPWTAVQG